MMKKCRLVSTFFEKKNQGAVCTLFLPIPYNSVTMVTKLLCY